MQTILISGASSGIGQALAMHYAKSAKTLILLGRNPLRMEQTHKACQRAGLEIISHLGDVNDQRSMHTFLQTLLQTHSIDIAFLNAKKESRRRVGFGHPDPKVIRQDTYYILDAGQVWLHCYTFSKEFKEKENTYDNLRLTILSDEFRVWMNTKAY